MKRGEPIALALLLLVAASGCNFGDEGKCPPPPETKRLETGAYAGKGSIPFPYYDGPVGDRSSFPHVGGVNRELSFDRASDTVRITYVRDGKTVVETWKAKSYRER